MLGIARIVKCACRDEAGLRGLKGKVARPSDLLLASVAFVVGNSSRVPRLGIVVYNGSPLQTNKEPLCKRVVIIERRSPHCSERSVSPSIKYQWVSLRAVLREMEVPVMRETQLATHKLQRDRYTGAMENCFEKKSLLYVT